MSHSKGDVVVTIEKNLGLKNAILEYITQDITPDDMDIIGLCKAIVRLGADEKIVLLNHIKQNLSDHATAGGCFSFFYAARHSAQEERAQLIFSFLEPPTQTNPLNPIPH